MKKINIHYLRKCKTNHQKIVWLTAYDYPFSRLADEAGVDMILVGDSAGNTTHGYASTIPMTMKKMMPHIEAVAVGAKHAFLVGDMPYMSYQPSDKTAIINAGKFIRAGMDAIKLEGDMLDRVKAIDKAGILVCGHLGLIPQSVAKMGGYIIQGKTLKSSEIVRDQALRLQDAGCSLLLLEAMPPEPAKRIAEELTIPVLGIGAGNGVDGQLLIIHDLLGLSFEGKYKFTKQYLDGTSLIKNAIKTYAQEVRDKTFPSDEYFYKMTEES